MYREITYKIRFPFSAEFKHDIQYILLKLIYEKIKQSSCICLNTHCDSCENNKQCIYYYLSGENFNRYPGICVKRSVINNKKIDKNDIVEISLYMIGNTEVYSNFITEIMDSLKYIGDKYFQKVLIKNEIINKKNTILGIIEYKTYITDIQDIYDCIEYYNQTYETKYEKPELSLINKKIEFTDYTKYRINGKLIKPKGIKGTLEVNNYPSELCTIGVGKYALLGWGRSEE